jgi:hypothetical protein
MHARRTLHGAVARRLAQVQQDLTNVHSGCSPAWHKLLPVSESTGKHTPCAGAGLSAWYTLAAHPWYTLADHAWYSLAAHPWYIIARLMTIGRCLPNVGEWFPQIGEVVPYLGDRLPDVV